MPTGSERRAHSGDWSTAHHNSARNRRITSIPHQASTSTHRSPTTATSSIESLPNEVKTPHWPAGSMNGGRIPSSEAAEVLEKGREIPSRHRHRRLHPTEGKYPFCWRYTSLSPLVLLLLVCAVSLQPAMGKTERPFDATTPLMQRGTEAPETNRQHNATASPTRPSDSIFINIAKRLTAGNELWQGIVGDCYLAPSFSCFQKNVYMYLNEALEARDVNVTQRLKFYRNSVDYEMQPPAKTTESAVSRDADVEEEEDDEEENPEANEIPRQARSAAAAESPIEEVTNALYGKSVKFALTHDVELQLPEMMFDGATFRISPRQIEGNGVIAKLELIPKQQVQARLFGKIIKNKIKKILKNKLILSFLALVLIIKIIKIKFFWLLPLVIGVGAAKKLLLKFLLFLFPALSHLFKLCSYYQQTYHSTKYHHHHHLINHHHTIVPPWHGGGGSNSVPEIIYTDPPKGHISTYLHGAPIHETYGLPKHEHFEGGWENSGPGLGSEYISDINRSAQLEENSNYFKPHPHDAHELHGWGLGTTQTPQGAPPQRKQQQQLLQTQQHRPPLSPQQQHQQHQKAPGTSHSFNPFLSTDKQRVYHSAYGKGPAAAGSVPHPVYTPPTRHTNPQGNHPQYKSAQQQPPPPPPQTLSPEATAQLTEALRIQAEQRIIAQQQKILENEPFVQDGQPLMPKNYDPFYSPILVKIDKIVQQLGVNDEWCTERVVCSMYKDPSRYSPHSNFVSAELSRDTSELQPVTSTNEAVLRFYRLIQAARDGQDQRDCLLLYPQCNINTE